MIKPFEIVNTRTEPEGTGVVYRVAKRFLAPGSTKIVVMEGYLLIPNSEPLDAGIYSRLKHMGYVE